MNIVLSTYFTTKPSPMRSKAYTAIDDCTKTHNWIASLSTLNLNGIIFYDNLSEQFIADQTTEYVQFVKYKLKTDWSVNDERYLCYKEFLESNPQYTQIFMTDLFDVDFFKNPFELINDSYKLYLGDAKHLWTLRQHKCLQKGFKRIKYNIKNYMYRRTVNAGTLGGNREYILSFLVDLLEEFIAVNNRVKGCYNINMPVFNKVLYDMFDEDQLFIGHPLTSKFNEYQTVGDFAIRHK